jgi:hypothetical protein
VKMAVWECVFVILDCCFILGVEGNSVISVTEGGLGVVDEKHTQIYRTDNQY